MVDSHAHLQHAQFDPDRDAVVERAVAAGVERILVPGWDVASSEAALELAERHAPVVMAAVGVHPHDAAAMSEADWSRLESLVADPRCVAVGEIGLDYHRNLSSPDVQREAFARQLELAATRNLPVLVHCREAHADVSDALLAWRGRPGSDARGALHAFSGDAAMATALAAAGFLVSFALPVAFRSATGPRAAAVALSEAALLVETDAPYLGPDRERRNEPTTVLRVAAELARLRGATPESIAAAARSAFERLVVA
ncbi:MAG: TatD family hydrolase [Chloroflexota bacterium]